MAPRSRATFAKRQKEQARQEKQRAKLQRKLDKKLYRQESANGPDSSEPSEAFESPENSSGPLQPVSFDTVPNINQSQKINEEQS